MTFVPHISHYTPNIYDPYNNISFVELNKLRRGEYNRSIEDRVYNRQYKPPTAKLYIRRNGDLNSRPKPFVWRIWKIQKLDDIVEEMAKHLDVLADGAVLYDSRGRIVNHPDEIIDGRTYVIGHHEPFDGQFIEMFDDDNNRYSSSKSNNSNYNNPFSNIHNNRSNIQQSRRRIDNMPRPESSFTFNDKSEIYSIVDNGSYDPPTIASPRNSDFGNYNMYRNKDDDEYYDETPWADLDELSRRDKQMLEKHKHKHTVRRSKSEAIYNRRDQTNPGAYIIYAFLNGQGLKCQHISFNRSQLEKGLPFILELVARRFNVKPSRLVNMDGIRIHDVSELMSRGAYILIPVGQSFRDTWYFLPDNAIDTSNDAERIRLRSAQRDRYIQKQEAKKYKQQKMKQTAARQTAGVYSRGYSLERNNYRR